MRKAKYLYEQNNGRSYFPKSWRDKKKEKQDQRKKGFKPPFFRGNPITFQPNQTSQSGSRIAESLGKRPSQSIKCWGCEGDHMFKYFPQRGSKTMEIHNIQEANIVDDVGRHVPIICATLDNMQA